MDPENCPTCGQSLEGVPTSSCDMCGRTSALEGFIGGTAINLGRSFLMAVKFTHEGGGDAYFCKQCLKRAADVFACWVEEQTKEG